MEETSGQWREIWNIAKAGWQITTEGDLQYNEYGV